jgi:hypothetical protein
MKCTSLFFNVLLANASLLFAYDEWSVPDLTAPTVIKPIAIEVRIQHQFWGRVDGNDAFSRLFGIGDGVDASFGFRSVVWKKAQVYASYDNTQLFGLSHNEFTTGVSYALFLPQICLRMQADGEIFSYASLLSYPEKRKSGYFVQGCFQNDPLFNRLSLLCNIGYDFDRKKPGIGFGIDAAITESFEVYGDYFPVLDKTDAARMHDNIQNPFSFGVKLVTPGHQFFLFISNAQENGPRHLMQGTSDNYLRLGFMLKRLFDFSKTH